MKAYIKSITCTDTEELNLPIGSYIGEVVKIINERYFLIKLDKKVQSCGWDTDCSEITYHMKVPDGTKFWVVPKRDICTNNILLIMDTE